MINKFRWSISGRQFGLLVFCILIAAASAAADIKLPAIISDNMVLQQDGRWLFGEWPIRASKLQ